MELNQPSSASSATAELSSSGITHDIFVSYHSHDSDLAQSFAKDLEQAVDQLLGRNVSVWQDQGVLAGDTSALRSMDEARQSQIFVPVVTPSWWESNDCRAELAAFRITSPGEALFPVLFSPIAEVLPEFKGATYSMFFQLDKGGTTARPLGSRSRQREIQRLAAAIARRLAAPRPGAKISREELKKLELEETLRLQEDYASLISDEVAPFFALAPYLPLELILPAWSSNLDELLQRGIFQQGPGPRIWSRPVVWMDQAACQSTLSRLRSRRPREFSRLMTEGLSRSGHNLVEVGGERLQADPTLWRWSRLAEASLSPTAFHQLLRSEVDQAVAQSQQARILWSPEARAWIEAAAPIAAELEGGYQAALAAAKRRLELFHRRAYDRSRLRNYVAIDELDHAFHTLLLNETQWALHFLGSGGVGKTMLIRHLSLDVAEQAKAMVSRIDFDYLNPQYPERDPILLLKALAEEFRLDESGDTARSFSDLDFAAEDVYARLEKAARTGQPVRPSLGDEDVQRAIQAFCEALAYLSHQTQPILILDTCEELAKVQPGVGVPLNVAFTLKLLQEIHDSYQRLRPQGPGLRVIFSGRRRLPNLPHLGVEIVRGFDAADAQKFLQRYRTPDDRPLDPTILDAILRITAPDGYSPYDLDTYAAWASVDPTLTEQKLNREGPLLYVRERIVERLNPLLRRIFPALVILGRFDRGMILQLIGSSANGLADLSEVLSQEWVLSDGAGAEDTWRIDDLFRQRVLRYYQSEDLAARREARNQLAKLLPELTRTRKLPSLIPQCFAACLNVLSETPVIAAAWWEDMEQRIAAEAEWQWAQGLLEHLQPETDDTGPMTAAIFATKAAVLLHTGGDPTPAWKVVEQLADAHPTPEGARRLRWRAACGSGMPDLTPQPGSLKDQDAASFVAYVERSMESQQESWPIRITSWPMRTNTWPIASIQAPDLRAFRDLLVARSAAKSQREILELFARAFASSASSFDPRQVWLDWIRPQNLKHRILLEYTRVAGAPFPGSYAPLAESLFTEPLASIDSDRLASAWLSLSLDIKSWRTLELREKFQNLYPQSVTLLAAAPGCSAHRKYPPLAVTLLQARGLSGDADWAREEIKSLSSRTPPADIQQKLDEVLLRIIVRMRLMSEGEPVPSTVAETPLAQIARALLNPKITVPDSLRPSDPMETVELAYLRGEELDNNDFSKIGEIRQDDLELLEVRMLQALFRCRRANFSRAKELALSVQPSFERLTAGQAKAPSWSDILAASKLNPAAMLDGMGPKPNVWRPWVVRILACIADPPRLELAQWISEHDVVVQGTARQAATELAFVLEELPPATAGQWLLRWLRKIGKVAFWGFAFCLFAAICWGMFEGYSALFRRAGIQLALGWRILSFLGVLVSVSWVPRLFGFMLGAYARLFSFSVEVEMQQPPADLNRPLMTPSTWRSENRILTMSIASPVRPVPATSSETYAGMLHDLDQKSQRSIAVRAFNWLSPHFPSLVLHLELIVDGLSAGAPWEAVMGPYPWAIIRRVTRERRSPQLPPWIAPMEVVTLGGDSTYTSNRDWGSNFVAKTVTSLDQYSQSSVRAGAVEKEGVLRVVGTPVDSTSGLSMRIRRRGEETYTVRGSDLLLRYPSLRLCILQCPPAELSGRLSNDRRVAALLKRIGAEVFSSGVPIVIVIPTLPDQASNDLIDKIYSIVAQHPANAIPKIVSVLAEFRRKPLAEIAADEVTATEVLLDVCFYALDKVSFTLIESERKQNASTQLVQ
jgi:hypothetical protein